MTFNFNNIGSNRIHLKVVDSTNNYTANLLKTTNLEEGTVILTDYQTNGKGMRGDKWISTAGENLLLSIFLQPNFLSLNHQFYLSKIVALSIQYAISSYCKNVKIKWPNDIYINNKKIAGILIENSCNKNKINQSIIGIGLNVNQNKNLLTNSTSLRFILGNKMNRTEVLNKICHQFNFLYYKLKQKKYNEINKTYTQNLLYYNETRFYYLENNTSFEAKIIGVNQAGKLKLQSLKNEVLVFDIKEVKFFPSQS